MKLLIATGTFPPEVSGMATIIADLADGFSKRGHEVTVITYGSHPELDSGSHKQSVDSDFRQNDSFKIIRIKRSRFKSWHYYKYFRAVLKHGKDVDLIFGQDLGSSGIPAWFASLFLNAKLALRLGGDFLWEKVFESRGVLLPFNEYYKQPKTGFENIYIFMFRRILDRARLVIFNSSFQAEIYKKYYALPEQKVRVLPNPIEVNVSTGHDRGDLVFAGRFIALKNVETLLRAFSKTKTDKRLILIGEGPRLRDYKKLISELHMNERVEIRSSMRHQELKRLISMAYLAIIPSLTEMNPNLAAEALSAGTPVLITRHSGLPEPIKTQLMRFDPLSLEDLTRKLEDLLDPEKYQAYCQKLSKVDFKYTREQMVEDFSKLFEQI